MSYKTQCNGFKRFSCFPQDEFMADEHERKFLITAIPQKCLTNPKIIRQGYLQTSAQSTTRIRIKDGKACITIKGQRTGLTRKEYEYEIPIEDASEMLNELVPANHQIHKTRYHYAYRDQEFEIDVFENENNGLILAELELTDSDAPFSLPEDWDYIEVTQNDAFYNEKLCSEPVSQWPQKPYCTIKYQ